MLCLCRGLLSTVPTLEAAVSAAQWFAGKEFELLRCGFNETPLLATYPYSGNLIQAPYIGYCTHSLTAGPIFIVKIIWSP